jgi:hypothetical protein
MKLLDGFYAMSFSRSRSGAGRAVISARLWVSRSSPAHFSFREKR